eukprot:7844932-Pyramimonas_sp.AAC.1
MYNAVHSTEEYIVVRYVVVQSTAKSSAADYEPYTYWGHSHSGEGRAAVSDTRLSSRGTRDHTRLQGN